LLQFEPCPPLPMPSDVEQPPRHRFLLRVAELLHAYGTPAFRLERVLSKVAGSLGVEGSFLSTPTSVLVSLGPGTRKEVHLVRGESGEVNLGKLVEFDEVLEDVEHGREEPGAATERLERIASAPSRFPAWVSALAFGTASGGAAAFFAGGPREIAASFAMAVGIYLLGRVFPRHAEATGVFEPLAAFLAAFTALVLSRLVPPLDDRVVTLASLIVLIPGLTLTTGFTELATRHLVSGIARVAGAGVVFLTLLFGVALGWRLGAAAVGPPVTTEGGVGLAPWTVWVVACVTPIAFAIILEARPREFGVVLAVSLAGYLAARSGYEWLGPDLGPFLGALVVGVGSNLYARRVNRPSLVPMTPGILLLVPGSLGFRSLTSFLDQEAVAGMSWAFQTGMVAVSLVGGLLAANIVLPPRRVL